MEHVAYINVMHTAFGQEDLIGINVFEELFQKEILSKVYQAETV